MNELVLKLVALAIAYRRDRDVAILSRAPSVPLDEMKVCPQCDIFMPTVPHAEFGTANATACWNDDCLWVQVDYDDERPEDLRRLLAFAPGLAEDVME